MSVLNMSGLAIEIHEMNFTSQNPFEMKNIVPSAALLHATRSGKKRRDKAHVMKKQK